MKSTGLPKLELKGVNIQPVLSEIDSALEMNDKQFNRQYKDKAKAGENYTFETLDKSYAAAKQEFHDKYPLFFENYTENVQALVEELKKTKNEIVNLITRWKAWKVLLGGEFDAVTKAKFHLLRNKGDFLSNLLTPRNTESPEDELGNSFSNALAGCYSQSLAIFNMQLFENAKLIQQDLWDVLLLYRDKGPVDFSKILEKLGLDVKKEKELAEIRYKILSAKIHGYIKNHTLYDGLENILVNIEQWQTYLTVQDGLHRKKELDSSDWNVRKDQIKEQVNNFRTDFEELKKKIGALSLQGVEDKQMFDNLTQEKKISIVATEEEKLKELLTTAAQNEQIKLLNQRVDHIESLLRQLEEQLLEEQLQPSSLTEVTVGVAAQTSERPQQPTTNKSDADEASKGFSAGTGENLERQSQPHNSNLVDAAINVAAEGLNRKTSNPDKRSLEASSALADGLGRPASAASNNDAASTNGSTAVQPGCFARQSPPSSGSSSSLTSSVEQVEPSIVKEGSLSAIPAEPASSDKQNAVANDNPASLQTEDVKKNDVTIFQESMDNNIESAIVSLKNSKEPEWARKWSDDYYTSFKEGLVCAADKLKKEIIEEIGQLKSDKILENVDRKSKLATQADILCKLLETTLAFVQEPNDCLCRKKLQQAIARAEGKLAFTPTGYRLLDLVKEVVCAIGNLFHKATPILGVNKQQISKTSADLLSFFKGGVKISKSNSELNSSSQQSSEKSSVLEFSDFMMGSPEHCNGFTEYNSTKSPRN